jgi:diguanylate cyclase (GGDEF)-like protein
VPRTRLSLSAIRRLRALASNVVAAPDLHSAAGALADGVAAVLDVPAVVERRLLDAATRDAARPGGPALSAPVGLAMAAAEVSGAGPATRLHLGSHHGEAWDLVIESDLRRRRDRLVFDDLARQWSSALDAPEMRHRTTRVEAIVGSAYAFARKLTRVHGSSALRQFILDAMAQAVGAQQGALALMDELDGRLRIPNTYGYPSVLVEHVRLLPGVGVMGRVFETRRPLLVRDIGDLPTFRTRRSRYRTASFLAVPLLANGDVLGVVSLTDRVDGRPFSRDDLTTLRALAAPAALALVSERLRERGRELAHAATVDPLTGLFNRRYFQTRLDEEVERARRYSLDLALLLADIDNFKQFNDTLGHLAGDYMLKQVADVLKRSVRMFDVCTRFGGEEFAILMPGSSVANAMVVAERIRTRVVASSRDDTTLPPDVRVTVSLGLAALTPEVTSQELIARADRALYRAKAEGKNCIRTV